MRSENTAGTGDPKARDLLAGIIAWRDELGELGRDLERMLRAAGVEPPSPTTQFRYSPPDNDRY
ncbi:MAG: hypothetical protein PHQ14_02855 [Chromatiales bacterium]|jgi:hypothetical protein|nr:hypothetical protein [Chromatiales bacterium]MDX9766920.1 hypothetical protein [Ectothiorhodospiraceae bacterium]